MGASELFDFANKLVLSKTRSAIPSGPLAEERNSRKTRQSVRLAKEFAILAIKRSGGEISELSVLRSACAIQDLVLKAAENELEIERRALAALEDERKKTEAKTLTRG